MSWQDWSATPDFRARRPQVLAVVRDLLGEDWLTPDRLRFGASSLLADIVNELAASM